MTELISFPFRISGNGSVVTRDDATDGYVAEEIAMLVLTRPEERELVPDFGIEDPSFGDFDRAELESKIEAFQIPASIEAIDLDKTSEVGKQSVSVSFNVQSFDNEQTNVVDEDDYEDDDDLFDAYN